MKKKFKKNFEKKIQKNLSVCVKGVCVCVCAYAHGGDEEGVAQELKSNKSKKNKKLVWSESLK